MPPTYCALAPVHVHRLVEATRGFRIALDGLLGRDDDLSALELLTAPLTRAKKLFAVFQDIERHQTMVRSLPTAGDEPVIEMGLSGKQRLEGIVAHRYLRR